MRGVLRVRNLQFSATHVRRRTSTHADATNRELAEPQKLLSYLLQPRVLTLPTDIISVYLQAAIKVFGSWAAELADRWDDEDLSQVRSTVDTVVEQVSIFASNADIEVQERVREQISPALSVFTRNSTTITHTGREHPRAAGLCQGRCERDRKSVV